MPDPPLLAPLLLGLLRLTAIVSRPRYAQRPVLRGMPRRSHLRSSPLPAKSRRLVLTDPRPHHIE
eukprot:6573430-Lingulodinium_polyedra.AAC.1